MEKITDFPRNLNGRRFQTQEGVAFRIFDCEHFPERVIAKQHRQYLLGLREGMLVSVSFYGQPVPLIIVESGVVRLIEIESGGNTVKGSLKISQLLGITQTRFPMRFAPVPV